MGLNDQLAKPTRDGGALLFARQLASHVGAFHDEAQFAGHLMWIGRTDFDSEIMHHLLEHFLMVRGGDMDRVA